jgi:hypothetical protein
MAEPSSCPVCGETSLEPCVSPPGIRVLRCRACGHRVAIHGAAEGPRADYHAQYDGGAFLESLRATRIRQAARLIELLGRRVTGLSAVVDYGAGRGWFLEACRSAGVAPVAGVDTSRLSIEELAASGIEARLLSEGDGAADALTRLSFRPRVVTLLDVVEHFPPADLRARLRSIVKLCGEDLEVVALKVPVDGFLYGAAATLCRAGFPGPLRQLYQAGTWPPHFNYFSTASAERLLASAGLRVVDRIGDPDFEPESLGSRIGATRPALRTLARLGGAALAAAVRVTGRYDSAVLLAKPSRA